jgi:hypothetical protein
MLPVLNLIVDSYCDIIVDENVDTNGGSTFIVDVNVDNDDTNMDDIVDINVENTGYTVIVVGTIPGIGGQYLLPTGSVGGCGYFPRFWYAEYILNLLI